jgi:hypothetical protein
MDKNPNYPWHRLARGEGFFVPALDVERVIFEGMRAALPYRFRDAPKYKIGVYKGRLGVMFYRGKPGRS